MAMSSAPSKVTVDALRERVDKCAVLILAAGFEARARRVLEMLGAHSIKRVILVEYPEGIDENAENSQRMRSALSKVGGTPSVVPLMLDPRRPDDFLQALKAALLTWRPDTSGEVWVDVTALPMQGICATLAAIRGALPTLVVQVLYTEALEYFPTKDETEKGEAPLAALSQEMSGNLIPKHFGGSSTAVSTCLIVFAGYEKHRSIGVVDELNPSRLVLVFGEPARRSLKWRLAWSKKLHEGLHEARPTAAETVSTLNPLASLRLLNVYYGFLFANHNIAVAPICSKMQCVASYLFWERYRDVQLVFPLPVTYLPYRFSRSHRHTFQFTLPTTTEMARVVSARL
jgi:hypothetical protein